MKHSSALSRALAALLALTTLTSAFAQGSADWKPSKMPAKKLGDRVERMFKTFKNTAGGAELNYTAPDPTDEKGYGTGRALMNEYFWSPTKFRIEYTVYGQQRPEGWSGPTQEYVASDGAGKIMRLGMLVPPGKTKFSASQKHFDYATDAQLVEAWPKQFPKLLFSPFVHGNATITRYISALTKGVGGYKTRVEERRFVMSNKSFMQYRIYATRTAKGNLPASTVEMIFDGKIWLPVTIHTTYGSTYDLNWNTTWLNHRNDIPGGPFTIGARNKPPG